jgi:hypothetical protein
MTKFHGLGDRRDAKLDHDGVGVAVDDLSVELVSVLDLVPRLDLVLRELDHLPAERSHTLGDLETGQLADLR